MRLEGAAVQGEQAEGGGLIWVRAVVLGTDTQADAAGLQLLVSWLPGASPLHTGGSSGHRPGRRRQRWQLLAHLHAAGGRHFPHRHLHRRRAAARHGGRLWRRLWGGGGSIRQLGSGGEQGAWRWAGLALVGLLVGSGGLAGWLSLLGCDGRERNCYPCQLLQKLFWSAPCAQAGRSQEEAPLQPVSACRPVLPSQALLGGGFMHPGAGGGPFAGMPMPPMGGGLQGEQAWLDQVMSQVRAQHGNAQPFDGAHVLLRACLHEGLDCRATSPQLAAARFAAAAVLLPFRCCKLFGSLPPQILNGNQPGSLTSTRFTSNQSAELSFGIPLHCCRS